MINTPNWQGLTHSPEHATATATPVGIFEFGLQLLSDTTVAAFAGEIDLATYSRFTGALSLLRNDGAPTLLLDLHEVSFISARGISALIEATERAREEGTLVRVHAGPAATYTASILGAADTLDGVAAADPEQPLLPGTMRRRTAERKLAL